MRRGDSVVGEALEQKAGVGFRGECQLWRGLTAVRWANNRTGAEAEGARGHHGWGTRRQKTRWLEPQRPGQTPAGPGSHTVLPHPADLLPWVSRLLKQPRVLDIRRCEL